MYEHIFDFNKEAQRARMKPHVDKLVNWLRDNYQITFEPTDGQLENVIFRNEDKVLKIAHTCFYRFSGLCKIRKVKPNTKQNEYEFAEVSDDDFINSYMKSVILEALKIEI